MAKQEYTLTSEVYELFHEHKNLFERPKGVWQAYEMAIVYDIYNKLTGKNDKDTGCGACRTNHVNLVRKAFEEYKKSL